MSVRLDETPFLGPSYDEKEIYSEICSTMLLPGGHFDYEKLSNDELLVKVSEYLSEGLVVGWFRDNIEFGARALGNRSILANPTLPNMKDKINAVIKKREGFRPFAPTVCYDKQNKYFNSSDFIPYMNQVVKVKFEYRNKLPAITHIDGTARAQSVTPSNSIYKLLIEFEKLSGYPILLNTSFNIKDRTMVLTPKDAVWTFLNTDIDILVMGDYLLKKEKI